MAVEVTFVPEGPDWKEAPPTVVASPFPWWPDYRFLHLKYPQVEEPPPEPDEIFPNSIDNILNISIPSIWDQLRAFILENHLATLALQLEAAAAFDAINRAVADARDIENDLTIDLTSVQQEVGLMFGEIQANGVTLFTLSDTVAGNSASITTEIAARASADTAFAGQITTINANIGTNAANITIEAGVRATNDTALAATITSLTATVGSNTAAITSESITRASLGDAFAAFVTSVNATTGSLSASITSESLVRTTADTALGARIDTVTATAAGNTAAISSEAVVRANADSALSVRIDTVSATAGQHVFFQTTAPTAIGPGDLWFDTDDGNRVYIWTGSAWVDNSDARIATLTASVTTETSARIAADLAEANLRTTLESTVNGVSSSLTTESATRATADSALSATQTTLRSDVDTNLATLNAEAITRANADSSISATITTLTATVSGHTAAIATEQTARSTADSSLATSITTVSAQATRQRVFLQTSEPTGGTYATGDLWFNTSNGNFPKAWNGAAWVDNSDGRYATIAASVTTETAARVSADGALSGRIDAVVATADGNTASITSEAAARASADGSLSTRIDNIAAAASQIEIFRQGTTPSGTSHTTGDLWFDTSNGNYPYAWNGSTWVDNSDGRFASQLSTFNAAITTEQTARASADTALASSITTVSASAAAAANQQRVFTQSSAPGGSHVTGDIWFDTSTGNKQYVWNGSSWVDASDARFTSLASSANRQRVYLQGSTPSGTFQVGDLWYDTSNSNYPYAWNGSAWVDNSDGRFAAQTIALNAAISTEQSARITADTANASLITTVSASAAAAQTTANSAQGAANRQRVYLQGSQPSGSFQVGDLWYDTSNSNFPRAWNGSSWVDNSDGRFAAQTTALNAAISTEQTARIGGDSANASLITTVSASAAAAQTAANTAQSTANIAQTSANNANTRQRVFWQGSAPTATAIGDLWYNSNDSNRQYIWTGSSWQDSSDARFGSLQTSFNSAITTEQSARASADSALSSTITTVSASATRQRVFVQNDPPSGGTYAFGDLWYDFNDGNRPYVWNGGSWVEISDNRFSTISASVTTETNARVSADSSLTNQINSLTSTVNGNISAISNEASTRASQDTAIASSVTSLTTTVNGHTTNISSLFSSVGEVQASWVLTVNFDGSTGRMSFTGVRNPVTGATQFTLEILGNVIIHGNLLIDGTVGNTGIANNAVSNASASQGATNSGTASINARSNSRIVFNAFYDGSDQIYYPFGFALGQLNISVNGPGFSQTYQYTLPVASNSGYWRYFADTMTISRFNVPAGTWSISASAVVPGIANLSGQVLVLLQEFSK
jgi:hypothetical protein